MFEPPCDKYCKTDEWLFSENWYSCYLRGIGCMQGKCWQYAEGELLRALKIRSEDSRWAVITYGEHTLPEYFPNRELGITYYNLHDSENALRYLLISYEQCPSAKTIYYINRIRKERLISSKEDIGPPRLFLKQDVFATVQPAITLSGVALDDTFVAKIIIQVNNENPLSLIQLSKPLFEVFEQKIFLKSGINKILIKVYDLLDHQTEKSIDVLVDQEGPIIYFAKTKENIAAQFSIDGIIYDPSDVKYFSLNHNEVTLRKVEIPKDPDIDVQYKAYYFSYPLSIDEEGKMVLHYLARDSFNNRTSGTIMIKRDKHQNEKKQAVSVNNRYVQLALGPETSITDLDITTPFCQIAKKTDLEPIQINISQFPKETFQKEISPQIEIRSNCQIRQVYIDDKLILSQYGLKWEKILSSLIRKYLKGEKEGRIVFPTVIKLKGIGENIISVKAKDEFGIIWKKDIMVIRKERQIDSLKERWRITIPYIIQNFEENEENKEKKSKKLTYELIEAFRRQQRFKVIERENLPKIIQEKKLHNYLRRPYLGLPKESRIWIDVILLGNVQTTDDSFNLSMDLVDLETGEILATKDVFEKIDPIDPLYYIWREKKWEHVFENCNVLASRFKEYFPLCEGSTINLSEEEIMTSICKNDGLKKGMKLIIYEKPIKNGEFLIINEAKVKEVHEKFSLAKLLEKPEIININDIGMNYAVITR
jgi:hypothetical protein